MRDGSTVTSEIYNRIPRNESRRTTDALLLSIWVFGYFLLIRAFGTLQHLERILSWYRGAEGSSAV